MYCPSVSEIHIFSPDLSLKVNKCNKKKEIFILTGNTLVYFLALWPRTSRVNGSNQTSGLCACSLYVLTMLGGFFPGNLVSFHSPKTGRLE